MSATAAALVGALRTVSARSATAHGEHRKLRAADLQLGCILAALELPMRVKLRPPFTLALAFGVRSARRTGFCAGLASTSGLRAEFSVAMIVLVLFDI